MADFAAAALEHQVVPLHHLHRGSEQDLPGVRSLSSVRFELMPGEVHGVRLVFFTPNTTSKNSLTSSG